MNTHFHTRSRARRTHRPAVLRTSRSLLPLAALAALAALACPGERAGKAAPVGATRDSAAVAATSGMAMPDAPKRSVIPGAEAQEPPGDNGERVALSAAQVAKGSVEWAPARAGVLGATATVPGQVVPNEDRTARLGAPARGRVLAVAVRPGDRVVAGQLLVTLASPEAGTAQSDAAKAEAELVSRRAQATFATNARERSERLLALKAIPRQEYERAVADNALATAALSQAEAEARRARSTAEQLGVSESPSGQVRLRSPLTGVVLTRTAVPGAVVEAGTPLTVVTDPSSLWLQVQAPEPLTALFRIGALLRFTVPASPSDTFSARIDAVGAALDPGTRTLPVRAFVANRDGRLMPEMLASVSVQGARTTATIVLPEDAVQLLDGQSVVFVATPDGHGGARFAPRVVGTGPRSNGRIGVTRGLREGELVATRGAFAIKAQLKKGSMKDMET
ncbi:MAG: efflux RND transporter periplasmic adaptor subunit [Gemmatimonadetes bacterium]|nr:efflux RND transporter periplasmic adaptor subunit [Gemmatimonadota bacterium]